MTIRRLIAILITVIAAPGLAAAGVVINEVFYRAPDDIDDLQWVELYNTSDQPVDLTGYAFTRGLQFKFPANTKIDGNGYLVIARNPDRFKQFYPIPALGPCQSSLSTKGEHLELCNAAGKSIDIIKYKDRDPWPASADGHSASLERICPTSGGDTHFNWAASLLSPDGTRAGGTPGKRNACYSETLPPAISKVTRTPEDPAPGQPLRIQAAVTDSIPLTEVTLLYRSITPNMPDPETAIPMTKDAATDKYSATIPAQEANRLVRYRIKATNQKNATRLLPARNDLRPTFSTYVHDKYQPGKIPLGFIINIGAVPTGPGEQPTTKPVRKGSVWGSLFGGSRDDAERRGRFGEAPTANLTPQGPAAFIYVDQKTAKQTVFDHINVTPRASMSGDGFGGFKVRFHKDHTLNGMSVLNLIIEGNERMVLAEPLAYELFYRVGSPAPLTDFLRITIDNRTRGYYLLVEQPNSSFLRRNKIKTGGNMYKLIWYGGGIVGQHEKKTNRNTTNHDDLVALITKLRQTSGDEQWKVIQDNFNVREFVNYYAVNMVLSDWDGFFNNFFTYHDTLGTGKWDIYPWDRDKTWGYHDGIWGDQVFTDMPLTFGMAGDRPPVPQGGQQQSGIVFGGNRFGGGGVSWWRPGGYFSAPLLANPQFRKLFLARTREICEKHYTPEVFFPLIDNMEKRLEDEARIRGAATGADPDRAVANLHRNMQSMKDHLTKRREFLLKQPELQ